jgi:para-aminobenzoate synthetase/4-amino-4-deoxychorismate lyase
MNQGHFSQQVVLQDQQGTRWLHFRDPLDILVATSLDQVLSKLEAVDRAVQDDGLYAAGFITYEASPAFDPALQVRGPSSLPLLWFGLYPPPVELPDLPRSNPSLPAVGQWLPGISASAYAQAIAQIKTHIANGDTYQVNYTFPLLAPFDDDAWELFLQLVGTQRGHYAAYVDTGPFAICSASPELFFCREGNILTGRPMKGTAPRGRTTTEDDEHRLWLCRSEKNRAENVMIVDMIRNDMGRIAEFGTVRVPSLFEIERYPTILQMTSTVACRTSASLVDILGALFPCASITGAPKVRTMQFIAELEGAPRGVYTGAIGYLGPGPLAQFNVAIRTVLVDRTRSQATYGVGSGIVWDSDPDEEYQECLIKAKILVDRPPQFDLLETMLWTPGEGYFLRNRHLRRLIQSAAYFDYALDLFVLQDKLKEFAQSLPDAPQRVRLLLAEDGTVHLEATPLSADTCIDPLHVGLAAQPIDADNHFLYHKTTWREVYEAAARSRPDCDDVLLWNERGELTESCIANVVVRLGGQLVTPPISCGLLPGTFRDWLLDQGIVREQVICLDDLQACEDIFLVNSVRRWQKAVLVPRC